MWGWSRRRPLSVHLAWAWHRHARVLLSLLAPCQLKSWIHRIVRAKFSYSRAPLGGLLQMPRDPTLFISRFHGRETERKRKEQTFMRPRSSRTLLL
ncbi:hypothetical protein LZ30DRAFT_716028 [Colletotrichum cereale]|nr:hypothetical protein LZ30DRAFT_716028 [Colletotrichum cereale]